MEMKLAEIAERIRSLRENLEISAADAAVYCGLTAEEYAQLESGTADISFTFLYRCAELFGVDMVELLTGEQPKLSFYSIIRGGEGLPIKRREGFTYQHLAHRFKGKEAEPFLVTAPYRPEEQGVPIPRSSHEGQEFDYILQGSLKVALEDHAEVLHQGDAIYYDSGHGHGMIATGGSDCVFLAIVLKKN